MICSSYGHTNCSWPFAEYANTSMSSSGSPHLRAPTENITLRSTEIATIIALVLTQGHNLTRARHVRPGEWLQKPRWKHWLANARTLHSLAGAIYSATLSIIIGAKLALHVDKSCKFTSLNATLPSNSSGVCMGMSQKLKRNTFSICSFLCKQW